MQNRKLNPKLLWMQFEDVLAPRLGLTVKERAVYSYLLRHSLVVGKLRLQFAVMSLARTLGISIGPVRQAVRRLDELGTLRVLKRSKTGHLAEMRLPEKIRALRPGKKWRVIDHGAVGVGTTGAAGEPPAATLETRDFLKTWALRKTIHVRERGTCFYCLRRTLANVRCLDHVVPACASDAIPTAIWFPAVSSATRARATARPRIFCALSTVWGASPRPNSTDASAP